MNFHQKPVHYVESLTLKVLDLKGMSRFYTEVLGFETIEQKERETILGVGGEEILTLQYAPEFKAKAGRFAGLYHFAVLLPNRKELGKILLHLHEQRIPIGSSDHQVSEALYLSDPEGNGIEIYRDREPGEWEWRGDQVHMTVDPLDVQEVAQASNGEKWSGMPAGTVLGHIHLHVSDLQAAHDFYTGAIGFGLVANLGNQALFVSDGNYHHHIGLNIWNGTGIPALPDQTAGLAHYVIRVADEQAQNAMRDRLQAYGADIHVDGAALETADPSGNRIRILTA
ncbi:MULTISPECIES: VOC family protein [unclassified Planococcus (in: firmicutes)]|uniref:VOC family protein n=1 Tax=unclassified Planococcus (in: firmicutes) TaxID=2662419 RepID=UPI000C33BEA4|nr:MULTISPECIES: VOC family protein [unclassified Planococcus (in: firmicutes)]AUD12847.1 glyoxalase [Planococcus sp. MB-3u-03]PKG47465.1 glyoxalase [Planococcus sp. Urea-trap-24]PKG88211.1 glyoxalase [Planococcus sp. Urea-3u-39]PKH36864.1 glyoxalase [Planococcus sp. MB-3u-09]